MLFPEWVNKNIKNNKPRNKTKYFLKGFILKKKKKYGTGYWYKKEHFFLEYVNKQKKQSQKILAFKERLKDELIWEQVINDWFLDKFLLLICSKYGTIYSLMNWKEIKLD